MKPTVDQLIEMLKHRVEWTYGGHGNVIETPDAMCEQAAQYLETARDLIVCLLENEPSDAIDDVGHVVLDLWRHDARNFLDKAPQNKLTAADLSESVRSCSLQG